MEISSASAPGKAVITAYGKGAFTVGPDVMEGSILVFEEYAEPWQNPPEPREITIESLGALLENTEGLDILVIGCGDGFKIPPKGLKEAVREKGPILEWMETGAAARTFNLLQTEGRQVRGAFLAL